ncbi:MAG: sugar transferase [Candidatus Sabulitectum sp.]|nr:sugar transferase [Candidatus Sabulitectum sp.]
MRKLSIFLGMFFDAAAIFLSLYLSAFFKFRWGIFPGISPVSPLIIVYGSLVSILYWWVIFALTGAYRLHWDRSWADEIRMVFKPVVAGFVILSLFAFLITPQASIGRWIFFVYFSLINLFVYSARCFSRLLERRLAKKKLLRRNVLVIGLGKSAKELEDYLAINPSLGYNVIGFINPPHPVTNPAITKQPLGDVIDITALAEQHDITDLLVTIASNFHDDILSLLLPAVQSGIRVKLVPDLFDVVAGHVHNTQILGQPLMELVPDRLSFWEKLVKTAGDYVISLMVIILGLPLWIIVSIMIVIDSKGGVFYRQKRTGEGGREYKIFKFRSMVANAEKGTGAVWAGKDDARVTKIGKIIRKTRIDEVPQFLNVLTGEMAVVGPRPERPEIIEQLRSIYPFYDKRLTVKPGITGWAQVNLEYDTNLEDVSKKLTHDFQYIENQSLFLDLEILARTVLVVLTGKGAH